MLEAILAGVIGQLVLSSLALDVRAAGLRQAHRGAGVGHPVAFDVVLGEAALRAAMAFDVLLL
ncbi:MAG: hypothetical protein ACHQXL_06730 [Candidatus Limnocylindrales bacterium]